MTAKQLAKFTRQVGPKDSAGCQNWQGTKNTRGYGKFLSTSAHRAAWELVFGPIPAGSVICHSCDNPSCVAIAHLFIGTQSDNERDKAAKKRHHFQTNPEYAIRAAKIGAARPERKEQLARARAARWPKQSVQS